MSYGLSENAFECICAVFARYPQIARVVLYGSRAKGNFREGSDIDLVLYLTSIAPDLISKLHTELDALNLPWTFDLSLYEELVSEELRAHIGRVGKVFYPLPHRLPSGIF